MIAEQATPDVLQAASRFLQFGQVPTTSYTATIDILHVLFSTALNKGMMDMDSVAGKYKGIMGKPVTIWPTR